MIHDLLIGLSTDKKWKDLKSTYLKMDYCIYELEYLINVTSKEVVSNVQSQSFKGKIHKLIVILVKLCARIQNVQDDFKCGLESIVCNFFRRCFQSERNFELLDPVVQALTELHILPTTLQSTKNPLPQIGQTPVITNQEIESIFLKFLSVIFTTILSVLQAGKSRRPRSASTDTRKLIQLKGFSSIGVSSQLDEVSRLVDVVLRGRDSNWDMLDEILISIKKEINYGAHKYSTEVKLGGYKILNSVHLAPVPPAASTPINKSSRRANLSYA